MALFYNVSSRLATSTLRRSVWKVPSNFSCLYSSKIHTSANMSKEQMEELQGNPYFQKYADKIAKLQKTSPEEFLSRLANSEKERKSANQQSGPQTEEKGFSFPTKPKKSDKKDGAGMTHEKKLEDRMKLQLLQDKTKEDIAEIWRAYHVNKDAVSAVIPAEMFGTMLERFKEFKTFLFPLPRKQGYEFVVVQFEGKEAHFTTLINFQAFKENAPECLTLIHYTEFADDKGIVLMVGEYDKNVLSREEAACLGVQALLFYGFDDAKKLAILDRFTQQTQEFNPLDVIAEFEASRNIPLAPLFKG